ncbi:hypothetical protein [Algibacillus agarilyticus]|uniref:hypothetical protein n=1 Tax=Algibacillus agarilyticus TaxID=2234133 RepID=UPI000DD0245C|nr:hypothetical protein [Algibacillus agarilyticus]
MLRNKQIKKTLPYLSVTAAFGLLVVLINYQPTHSLLNEKFLFYDLPATTPTPKLTLFVEHVPAGTLLRLTLENYQLSNECKAKGADEILSGHAHLYLDGKKLSSLFSSYYLWPRDETKLQGLHKISVSLHLLPDHRAIRVNGQVIQQDIMVDFSR